MVYILPDNAGGQVETTVSRSNISNMYKKQSGLPWLNRVRIIHVAMVGMSARHTTSLDNVLCPWLIGLPASAPRARAVHTWPDDGVLRGAFA